jgi:glycosyltransferase involved in cell wall biosynthesis
MPSTLMLLTYPFRPDPRVLREARSIVKHGLKVQLMAWDRDGALPKHATEHGIDVLRLGPKCPYRSAGKVLSRLPRFWLRALNASRKLEFGLVHCHDFDTLPLGLMIGRLRGKPVLYDAHEIYSAMIRKDIGGFSRIMWWLERMLSSRADGIVTVNDALAKSLTAEGKSPPRIVMNSPDTSVLDGANAAEIRARYDLKGFVVSYLGSLEPGRFVQEMVSSIEPSGKLTLAIGGDGTMRPAAEKASLGNPSIKFLGTLDTDEALRVTWASDLIVTMLDPTNPNYRVSTPVKVLDAMACGKPMILSEGLDISVKVKEMGSGFVIPYDRDAFKSVISNAMTHPDMLKEMGRNGKSYFDQNLSWLRSEKELLAVYTSLLGQSNGNRGGEK